MDPQEKKKLEQMYKKKKIQQLSLDEYEALKKAQMKKEKRKLPKFIRILFSGISFLLFIFGVFFLISLLYLIAINWK